MHTYVRVGECEAWKYCDRVFFWWGSWVVEVLSPEIKQPGHEADHPSRLSVNGGAACWYPYREGQISALDRVQKKAVKFAHHTNIPNWETLASRRKLSRICALFKAYSGERAWKPIGDRLQRPHYLSRVDHERNIGTRRQRKDIGKYSFVNRTIKHWNQLPVEVLGNLPCKPFTFKKRVRKVINELN